MRAQLLEDCTAMASDPLAPVAQATTRTTACQSGILQNSMGRSLKKKMLAPILFLLVLLSNAANKQLWWSLVASAREAC